MLARAMVLTWAKQETWQGSNDIGSTAVRGCETGVEASGDLHGSIVVARMGASANCLFPSATAFLSLHR